MADGGYTILHRKDERGVIVESGTFGPDDEVPDGFEVAEYEPIDPPGEDPSPVDESNLTPWESPIAKNTWVEQRNEAVEQAAEDAESDEDEGDEDELDEGSPQQAREQAGEELTEAEQEAAADSESEDDGPPPRGGAGSGSDAWAAYAAAKNVEVPGDASRDEIIAAVEKAGHPV